MWTDKNCVTVGIEFTIGEINSFLKSKGYEIVSVEVNEKDFDISEVEYPIRYLVPYPSDIYDNIKNEYWRNENIHHPKDAIRLVFEREMKKKLLKC